VAAWQDGSDFYLYGTFISEGVVSKEDTYRCFVSSFTAAVFQNTPIIERFVENHEI